METKETAQGGYQLGSDATELARLQRQGRVLAPATRAILQAAGIRSGMRVLDLGSGMGDMAFAAVELVGSTGEVVGVEVKASATATSGEAKRPRTHFSSRKPTMTAGSVAMMISHSSRRPARALQPDLRPAALPEAEIAQDDALVAPIGRGAREVEALPPPVRHRAAIAAGSAHRLQPGFETGKRGCGSAYKRPHSSMPPCLGSHCTS